VLSVFCLLWFSLIRYWNSDFRSGISSKIGSGWCIDHPDWCRSNFLKCGWNTNTAIAGATDGIPDFRLQIQILLKIRAGWYITLSIWLWSNFFKMWLKYNSSNSSCHRLNFKFQTSDLKCPWEINPDSTLNGLIWWCLQIADAIGSMSNFWHQIQILLKKWVKMIYKTCYMHTLLLYPF